jgi:hypothetical protein
LLKTVEKGCALNWNLHFLLGAESSVDEMGIAAYKTIELDDYLGGGPIQYREVQGNESDLFMSYFKASGLKYLDGGVESGFNKVERDVYKTRLLQCKGKRTVRVNEVKAEFDSLNCGDVFILDKGLKIWVFNGEDANRYEKTKGASAARKIKDDERGSRAEIWIVGENDADDAEFWEELGGKAEVTESGADDAAAEQCARDAMKLMKVSDATGSLVVEEQPKPAGGVLVHAMLSTDDVFIVDAGTELFLWIGKKCTAAEKKEGMVHAATYLTQSGKPMNTRISRVVEGAENAMFKDIFAGWPVAAPAAAGMFFGAAAASGVAKAEEDKEIDVGALMAAKKQVEKMVDDGSGDVKVWRIEDMKKAELEEAKYGQFYDGDSYIVLYTYWPNGKDKNEEYIIYFWQGRNSSADEKGASALLAKDMDDEMGDRPVQCRVPQGREPAHFRTIFGGKMLVHKGGKASGFKNTTEVDVVDDDGVSLYHIKGSDATDTYGIQVDEVAGKLNSGDCFVLLSPATMYIWQGGGSNETEQETAGKVADTLRTVDVSGKGGTVDRAIESVKEGEESEAFWGFLGGKAEYAKFSEVDVQHEPRLFQCNNTTGGLSVTEMFNFTQEDLIDDDVMLLDCFNTVYMWMGSAANLDEKKKAAGFATKYIERATDGRDQDAQVVMISAGFEPKPFAFNFMDWDEEYTMQQRQESETDKDERLQREAKMRDAGATDAEIQDATVSLLRKKSEMSIQAMQGPKDAATTKFTLAELQDDKTGQTLNIDVTNKEDYLSDAEFKEVLGVERAGWADVKAWKKKSLKQAAGLF